MNGSSVVVVPPSGDMAAYIESSNRLLELDIETLGPAHGDVITTPKQTIQKIVRHRLLREQKVISAMAMIEAKTIEKLVPLVYDDVPEEMHGVAYFSLWAHLEKLLKEQRVAQEADRWSLIV